MAPKKQKQFSKPPKKAKESQLPETENDFLEAADGHEASAGKWKAGDSARALRFYQRAIATYDEGLKKFPKSFDLAYNKALLLYNITQEKRVISQLGSVLDILKDAIEAHKYALGLDQENADVLFNTAQVLTSFAEELNDSVEDDGSVKQQAVSYLQEAVELFNACLNRQELEYSEMQELIAEASKQPTTEQTPPPATAKSQNNDDEDEEGPGEWATVKEPVTPSTLIETALAQLGSLSSLASIAAPTSGTLLAKLTEIANPLVTQKLPSYISLLPTSIAKDPNEPEESAFLSVSASSSTFHARKAALDSNPQATAKLEADLAIAMFTAAVAGSEYQSGLLGVAIYHQRVTQAFEQLAQASLSKTYPESSQAQILSAHADALIEFADNVSDSQRADTEQEGATHRWTALEAAQVSLTQATNIVSGIKSVDAALPSKAHLYFTRGNVEMLRRRLTQLPTASNSLKANEKVLLKNAGVYYRGAAALAKQDGDTELDSDATMRNRVVQAIEQLDGTVSAAHIKKLLNTQTNEEADAAIDEMVQEGILSDDD